MTNKIATASFTTVDVPLPAGVSAGGFVANLLKAGVVVDTQTPSASGTVEFSIAQGASDVVYTITVARVADSGENLASPAESDPFTIPALVVPPTMVSVPLKVVVAISDAVEVPASVAVAVA